MEATLCTGQKQKNPQQKKKPQRLYDHGQSLATVASPNAERRSDYFGLYDDPLVSHCPSAYWADLVLSNENRSLYPPPIDAGPRVGSTKRCPTRRCRRQHRGRILPSYYVNAHGLCYDCYNDDTERSRRMFHDFTLQATTPWGKLRQWLKDKGADPVLADLLGLYVEALLFAEAIDIKRLHHEIHRRTGEWLPNLTYREADLLLDQIKFAMASYDGAVEAPKPEKPMAAAVADALYDRRGRIVQARILPEGDAALRAEIERYERTGEIRDEAEGTP